MKHYTPDLLNRTILEPLVEPAENVAFALDNIDGDTSSAIISNGGTMRFRRFSGNNPRFGQIVAETDSVGLVRQDGLTFTGSVGATIFGRQFEFNITGMTIQYPFDVVYNPFPNFFDFDFTIPAGTTLTRGFGVDPNRTNDAVAIQGVIDATAAANVGNPDFVPAQNGVDVAVQVLRENSRVLPTDRFRMYTGILTQAQIPDVSDNRVVLATISGTDNLVHLLGDLTASVFNPGVFSTTVRLPDIIGDVQWNGVIGRNYSATQGWWNLDRQIGDLRNYIGATLQEAAIQPNGASGDFVTTVVNVLIQDNLGRWSSDIDTFFVEGNSHLWRVIFPNNLQSGRTGTINEPGTLQIVGPVVEQNILGQII